MMSLLATTKCMNLKTYIGSKFRNQLAMERITSFPSSNILSLFRLAPKDLPTNFLKDTIEKKKKLVGVIWMMANICRNLDLFGDCI